MNNTNATAGVRNGVLRRGGGSSADAAAGSRQPAGRPAAGAGATIPFARTRRERETAGDPRPSIEERYRSREDYLERVRRAGAALVAQRYMLEEDIELAVTLAARAWDHWTA